MQKISKWVVAIGLVLGSTVHADDLSRRSEKRVLFAIDQICGDTWCEGDFNFRFERIRCNFTLGSCALEFRTAPWKTGMDQEYRWGETKVCAIRNVGSLSDLISTERANAELKQDPYEQITTCIQHLTPRHFE